MENIPLVDDQAISGLPASLDIASTSVLAKSYRLSGKYEDGWVVGEMINYIAFFPSVQVLSIWLKVSKGFHRSFNFILVH